MPRKGAQLKDIGMVWDCGKSGVDFRVDVRNSEGDPVYRSACQSAQQAVSFDQIFNLSIFALIQ